MSQSGQPLNPRHRSCAKTGRTCRNTRHYGHAQHWTGAALVALFLTTSAQAAEIKVAVTTSFYNSGLSDILLSVIKDDLGLDVQQVVVGTGQALRLGKAGDPTLFNQYAFIPVSPVLHPHVKADLAVALEGWLISPKAEGLISNYRINGELLFTFNAVRN